MRSKASSSTGMAKSTECSSRARGNVLARLHTRGSRDRSCHQNRRDDPRWQYPASPGRNRRRRAVIASNGDTILDNGPDHEDKRKVPHGDSKPSGWMLKAWCGCHYLGQRRAEGRAARRRHCRSDRFEGSGVACQTAVPRLASRRSRHRSANQAWSSDRGGGSWAGPAQSEACQSSEAQGRAEAQDAPRDEPARSGVSSA